MGTNNNIMIFYILDKSTGKIYECDRIGKEEDYYVCYIINSYNGNYLWFNNKTDCIIKKRII